MDQILVDRYETVVERAKIVLSIESIAWPMYVRSEFAELRKAIQEVGLRKEYLSSIIRDISKSEPETSTDITLEYNREASYRIRKGDRCSNWFSYDEIAVLDDLVGFSGYFKDELIGNVYKIVKVAGISNVSER